MHTHNLFDDMAARYDTPERIADSARIAGEIRAELQGADTRSQSALDYGCGTGLVGLALADLFGHMLFTDASGRMVELVEHKIDAAEVTNASALCCDLLAPPLPDLHADCVMLSRVLLHVKDYPLLLERLYDVVNEGGHLIAVDFDKNEGITSDLVHNGFHQAELAQLLERIGFARISSRTFHSGERLFMDKPASLFLLHARK